MSNQGTDSTRATDFDAVVIGAGFSGLYMLYKLREIGLSARAYEAAKDVGGTWYWNRYPGARCDIPSGYYAYSFSPELSREWTWTEGFPSQPEILRYLQHVADRFDLRRDIQFETQVTAAHYDEAASCWRIATHRGETVTARYLISGMGCFSAPNTPPFPGSESFRGRIFHTAKWPEGEVDFTGRRVGVIGTGSSGIQIIPIIAQQAAQLTVFQRTPNYSLPARSGPMTPARLEEIKAQHQAFWEANRTSRDGITVPHLELDRSVLDAEDAERQAEFERGWAEGSYTMMRLYRDLTANLTTNQYIADFVRAKIAEIVVDPEVAKLLTPTNHPLGSKRLPIDEGYYAAFNRPNVRLVDVRSAPIQALTPDGLRTTAAEYELDDIIFATGFDALTGPLLRIDIRGRQGLPLKEKWADGPHTYLGIQTAGFPNLFTITGPGSPSVLSNVPVSIEQHVEWIADCLVYLRDHAVAAIEPETAAEASWTEHVNEVAAKTLYPLADSWFLGANIPGKPRAFMPYAGGVGHYRKLCSDIAAQGYAGFVLAREPAPAQP